MFFEFRCYRCFSRCPDGYHDDGMEAGSAAAVDTTGWPTYDEIMDRINRGVDTPDDWAWKRRILALRDNFGRFSPIDLTRNR